MKTLFLIVKEDLINLIKNPMWIFYATLFPILLVVTLGFLTNESYSSVVSSFDYYGITLIIYSALMSGLTSSNAFLEEKIKKPNMRIIYAPCRDSYIYISKIVATFIFEFIFHLIDMAILVLIFNIHLDSIFHLIIILALVELFSVTLGIMMCCIFKTEMTANQILSIVINLLAILGGLVFSLDGYGKVVRAISLCSPFKYITKNIFQIIYDNDFSLFLPVILILVIGTMIMLGICKLTFKKEDYIC